MKFIAVLGICFLTQGAWGDGSELDDDPIRTHMIEPSIRIVGNALPGRRATLGSGTLVAQERIQGGAWRSVILTAFHVVRDILIDQAPDFARPFTIEAVSEGGTVVARESARPMFAAELASALGGAKVRRVQTSQVFDLWLVEVVSQQRFGEVAKLPTLESLRGLRPRAKVHLVGFPLGLGPYHTVGELGPFEEIGEQRYRLLSAPAYVGNSGGGVFRDETHELIGVMSKLHFGAGALVPHLGCFVPIEEVYYWLYHMGLHRMVPAVEAGSARG